MTEALMVVALSATALSLLALTAVVVLVWRVLKDLRVAVRLQSEALGAHISWEERWRVEHGREQHQIQTGLSEILNELGDSNE